jgi:hypothetical protein
MRAQLYHFREKMRPLFLQAFAPGVAAPDICHPLSSASVHPHSEATSATRDQCSDLLISYIESRLMHASLAY